MLNIHQKTNMKKTRIDWITLNDYMNFVHIEVDRARKAHTYLCHKSCENTSYSLEA